MLKNLFFIALAGGMAIGVGYADQAASKASIPVTKTSASDGKQMYISYCAPCHGVSGKGDGPVAGALKQKPTDLTLLSRNHGGSYPTEHVISILRFGTETAAHGNAQMPVWGQVLSHMDASTGPEGTRDLRISNLAGYIQLLQVK